MNYYAHDDFSQKEIVEFRHIPKSLSTDTTKIRALMRQLVEDETDINEIIGENYED